MNWQEGPAAAKWIPVINAAEHHHGVPINLSARECFEESRFNPLAKNPKSGCIGLMQLLPKDFPGAGVNPIKDIDTGVGYLAHLFGMFNDWQLALAAYDWGPGNLRKALKKPGFGLAALPPETRNYVTQIIRDVPVTGVLCKTPSLPSLSETGSLPSPSLPASALAKPLPKSFLRSVLKVFTGRSTALPTTQLSVSVPLPPVTLSPTENQGVNSMSNPALVAIAPALNNVLDAVNQFGIDIGPDPAKWAVTVLPAAQKLLSTVELQIPVVITAEGGQLQGLIAAKVQELKAKLAAATAPQTVAAMPAQSA